MNAKEAQVLVMKARTNHRNIFNSIEEVSKHGVSNLIVIGVSLDDDIVKESLLQLRQEGYKIEKGFISTEDDIKPGILIHWDNITTLKREAGIPLHIQSDGFYYCEFKDNLFTKPNMSNRSGKFIFNQ